MYICTDSCGARKKKKGQQLADYDMFFFSLLLILVLHLQSLCWIDAVADSDKHLGERFGSTDHGLQNRHGDSTDHGAD